MRSGQAATQAYAPLAIALHWRYYFCPVTVHLRLKLQYIWPARPFHFHRLLAASNARLENRERLENKIHPGT